MQELQKVGLMEFLTPAQLPSNLQQQLTYRRLTTGQILFQQGEQAQSVFILESGQLRVVSFTDQKIINHYFVKVSENFAEIALFSETYTYTAMADIPSRVIVIPKSAFLEALHNSTELSMLFMKQFAHRLKAIQTLLELRSIRSARERIMYYLQLNLQPNQTTVTLEKSLKDIATELGLVPEVLSRNLALLQEEGVITRKKRSITFNE